MLIKNSTFHTNQFSEKDRNNQVRVVYDASAKSSRESPSLNECLEKAPPLQNILWNILGRNIQKAFPRVRIRESDRDALRRFHWIKNQDISQIDIIRFTRLVFGLTQPPFVLEATLGEHISKYGENHEKIAEETAASMCVNNLISGG